MSNRMETIAIRTVSPAEADTLAAIHERSATAAYRHIFPADSPFPRAATRDGWARHLAAAERFALLVEAAGEAVGFVAAGPGADGVPVAGAAEIHGLHLRPERCGQGLGRLLLDTALARLRQRGFPECIVWVLRENARGRGFYERLGWRWDGAQRIDRQAAAVVILRYRRLL